MKSPTLGWLLAAALCASSAYAAAPSAAPAGATGMCKDGTYSSAAEKKGACRGHKGVKEWYSDVTAQAAPAAVGGASAASSRAAARPSAKPTREEPPAAERGAAGRSANATAMAPAAGGGPGKVWVNTGTKVYHCDGHKYYGTTKQGEYMSESDAKAKGFHADHGKACT